MDLDKELELLNLIDNFAIPKIPEETRFWMIRTQKGYFYNEFIKKKFVALAWNNIDAQTDLSEDARERLKDEIVVTYKEISRPSTVINKCANFIHEISAGDILVIPSKGSKYITFAIAGEYFEDPSKTVELEQTVIYRINNNDVDVNDVSCPYKKRRHIRLLRTIESEDLNYSLYRAISNHHGISNFDNYAYQILNKLYNCYSYRDSTVLVYNIRKNTPIKPRELSQLIYGNTECLCSIISEERLSTQMNLNSPGDVVYILKEAYEFAKENWAMIFGLLVFLGGGSALSFNVPGIIDIIKNIACLPQDIKSKELENESRELEIIKKRLEINEKIKASGIDPQSLVNPLEAIVNSTTSLKAEPIKISEDSASMIVSDDEDEESTDTDEG